MEAQYTFNTSLRYILLYNKQISSTKKKRRKTNIIIIIIMTKLYLVPVLFSDFETMVLFEVDFKTEVLVGTG